jgi:transposase
MQAQILALQADLKAVLARLNRRNASKSPAGDGSNKRKPRPTSLRVGSEPPAGGQKGHPGSTLCQAQQVDAGVIHDTPKPCDVCKRKLPAASVVQTRQVFGLPILKFEVTEHCAMQAICRCGNQNHAVSVQRISELMKDFFGLALSQATVVKAVQIGGDVLAPTAQAI